ncbi:MAG: hypothetical protein WDO15_30460 [Bacteroidota bacterium]
MTYWSNISATVSTLFQGLMLTGKHIIGSRKSKKSVDITSPGYFEKQTGIATIQFPTKPFPFPTMAGISWTVRSTIASCVTSVRRSAL